MGLLAVFRKKWTWIMIGFTIGVGALWFLLFWKNYQALPGQPTVGLNDTADLGRVIYETGSLILCIVALISGILGFAAPFTIFLWSQMTDSYFDLFIQLEDYKFQGRIGREKASKIQKEIRKTLRKLESSQETARGLFYVIIVVCIGALVLLALIIMGVPCWNVAQYLWLRGILYFVSTLPMFCIIYILFLFVSAKPDTGKRARQIEIIDALFLHELPPSSTVMETEIN